jgi:ATPase family associated with various cellular activities (AAA)
LLPSNKIVETSALDLMAGYVGQTATKVKEALSEAKGGVLFIDEAYNLGFGPYGKEACDTILEAMTSEKFKDVVIVIAGYPHEIDRMLNSNGLKSRFTHYFEFPDWMPDDCKSFFELLCTKKKFSLADGALQAVETGCRSLIELDGWANGRDVTKLWEQVKSNRDARVYDSGETSRVLVLEDVNKAVSSMLAARVPKADKRTSGKMPFHEMSPPMAMESMHQNSSPQVQTTKLQERDPTEEVPDEDQAFEPTEPATEPADQRDDGVDDEVWSELQAAKERDRARQAQLQREQEEYEQWLALLAEREQEARRLHELELERMRLEILQREEQERAIREAQERERLRKEREELERRRREAERLRREEEILQAKETQKRLRVIGNCPAGYVWHKTGSEWRCAGGSHFVSDEQLNRQYGFDA